MPDISMCGNEDCPSKQKCYRYMAVPDPWRQSYACFSPEEGYDKCDMFWPIERAVTKLREDLPDAKT